MGIRMWLKNIWEWQPREDAWWVVLIRRYKLPGIKDAIKSNTKTIVRVFWVSFVVALLSMSFMLIIGLYVTIINTPAILVYKPAPIYVGEIPFPKGVFTKRTNFDDTTLVELENMIRLAKKENEVNIGTSLISMQNIQDFAYLANHFCYPADPSIKWYREEKLKKITLLKEFHKNSNIYDEVPSRNFDDNMLEFFASGVPKCSSIAKLCILNGEEVPCDNYIQDTQTDVGAACAINKPPDSVLKKNQGLYTKINENPPCKEEEDAWSKWEMNKDMFNPIIVNSSCFNQTGGQGMKIVKSIPLTQNRPGFFHGFSMILQFDKSSKECLQHEGDVFHLQLMSPYEEPSMFTKSIPIQLNSEVFVSVEPDITVANEAIRKYSKESRGCLFSDEGKLEYFHHYTQANCQSELLAKQIFDVCKCAMASFPNANNTLICTSVENLKCARKVQSTFRSNSSTIICPPGCTDIKYDFKVDYIPYSPVNPPSIIQDNPNIDDWDLTAAVTVAFTKESYYAKYYDERMSIEEFIASAGGTLGLTNGLSGVDLFRVMYETLAYMATLVITTIFTVWAKLRGRRQNTATQAPTPAPLPTPTQNPAPLPTPTAASLPKPWKNLLLLQYLPSEISFFYVPTPTPAPLPMPIPTNALLPTPSVPTPSQSVPSPTSPRIPTPQPPRPIAQPSSNPPVPSAPTPNPHSIPLSQFIPQPIPPFRPTAAPILQTHPIATGASSTTIDNHVVEIYEYDSDIDDILHP